MRVLTEPRASMASKHTPVSVYLDTQVNMIHRHHRRRHHDRAVAASDFYRIPRHI